MAIAPSRLGAYVAEHSGSADSFVAKLREAELVRSDTTDDELRATLTRALAEEKQPAGLPLLEVEGDWEEVERVSAAVSGEARGLIHYRMMALRHLATVAIRRPFTQPARAGISTPWQTLAIGLPAVKKCLVMRIRSSS